MIDLSQNRPTDWETILLALAKRPGVTMFLGASDTGKTTRLRCAATYLARAGLLPLTIVDADVGQSTIGPPTTVGLTLVTKDNLPDLLSGRLACIAMRFIGALSPLGHLLQTIVATKMLVDKGLRRGARAVLVDTTGLVGQNVGFQLKLNKVELLEPRPLWPSSATGNSKVCFPYWRTASARRSSVGGLFPGPYEIPRRKVSLQKQSFRCLFQKRHESPTGNRKIIHPVSADGFVETYRGISSAGDFAGFFSLTEFDGMSGRT